MKILEKEKNENTRTYVLRVLTENIIDMQLPPGSLVSENDISVKLNVSRTPVREAIIELSKQELIDVYPQRGSYVSKLDYELIEETRFMRLVLEKSVLELACEQGIPEETLLKLRQNVNMAKYYLENSQRDQLLAMDNEFHKLIFESVNKTRIYQILKLQMIHFDRLRSLTMQSIKDIKIVEDHENILYALERKDSELACMMITRHLGRHQIEKEELIQAHPDYFK